MFALIGHCGIIKILEGGGLHFEGSQNQWFTETYCRQWLLFITLQKPGLGTFSQLNVSLKSTNNKPPRTIMISQ